MRRGDRVDEFLLAHGRGRAEALLLGALTQVPDRHPAEFGLTEIRRVRRLVAHLVPPVVVAAGLSRGPVNYWRTRL
jgi:hypothetical protein